MKSKWFPICKLVILAISKVYNTYKRKDFKIKGYLKNGRKPWYCKKLQVSKFYSNIYQARDNCASKNASFSTSIYKIYLYTLIHTGKLKLLSSERYHTPLRSYGCNSILLNHWRKNYSFLEAWNTASGKAVGYHDCKAQAVWVKGKMFYEAKI